MQGDFNHTWMKWKTEIFWNKFKDITMSQMLKIEQSRFPGLIIPQIGDVVCLPDKIGRAGNLAIGIIVEIKDSHDGEVRVCKIKMARKSSRNHPLPLQSRNLPPTTVIREFTRHIKDMIFLLRPKPNGTFDNVFLYEDILQLGVNDNKNKDETNNDKDNNQLDHDENNTDDSDVEDLSYTRQTMNDLLGDLRSDSEAEKDEEIDN